MISPPVTGPDSTRTKTPPRTGIQERGPVRESRSCSMGRHHLHNRTLWACLAAVLVLRITAVQAPFAQDVFDTVALSTAQRAVYLLTSSSVLLTEHARRAVYSRHGNAPDAGEANRLEN
ncbi:cation transporting ATPase C-terminal domain-containing protein [Streptomyces sp. NPDC057238]|uniref:cation transporting ATPase C-terminal domain-containing protein n=1 Tax=Streptomyces sp. NPDC057238 TaxID=3346060 RepID=UPI0036448E5E